MDKYRPGGHEAQTPLPELKPAYSSGINGDMQKFMQALVQAIKSDSPSAASAVATTGSTTNSPSNFASGLSALIYQVGNGSAPTDLQNAFTQFSSDLQSANLSGQGLEKCESEVVSVRAAAWMERLHY
jgi:hypothetical protein